MQDSKSTQTYEVRTSIPSVPTELESHFASAFVACDTCDVEENISQLWGVAMHAWQRKFLERITCSDGSLGRKTCLLDCKTGSGKV